MSSLWLFSEADAMTHSLRTRIAYVQHSETVLHKKREHRRYTHSRSPLLSKSISPPHSLSPLISLPPSHSPHLTLHPSPPFPFSIPPTYTHFFPTPTDPTASTKWTHTNHLPSRQTDSKVLTAFSQALLLLSSTDPSDPDADPSQEPAGA